METSPKQGSVCSTTSPPRCLCHHRSSQKEVCLCGGTGRAETTPKTMIRSHARPCFSSSPSPPTTTHPWTPRASAENHDRPGLDNPCLISSNMSPSLERRRPSAGDVTRKKSPSPLQDESTASSPKEHISNHRRLVHQKHQYNQYLLGHPDCFDFHLATNDFEQGGDESFRQKTTMDKSIRDKKKAMLGGGRRGVHAFQRQRRRRWRVVQRWSIIISLVVVLAAGTALIMHFVAQRPWTSAPAAPLESVVEEVGGGVAPHIQHVTAPSSNPRDILEPSATDILLRQEQVYAQDPQQERVDRLLYRGGGDRWIVHRSALVAEQVLRLQQLQRQQEQERQNARSLLLESDEADPDGIRVRQQPGTANLLDFHPDDDDDD
ncbi:hypothetical protein BGZ73_001002 [Actinomortierella ambigua]|nr:hypothetical protein BGZ73_001002 [Actinomortierella ambigua]